MNDKGGSIYYYMRLTRSRKKIGKIKAHEEELMGKDKKEKKEKKPSTGRLRGFIGVLIAVLLFVGVGVCDTLLSGKKMFSFVSTGSVMDRFDPATAETSKEETEIFFNQAATLFSATADQKYTSYTLKYTADIEQGNYGLPYTKTSGEMMAAVDKDYTVVTISKRYAEGLLYSRQVTECVIFKTGANAGETWIRSAYADASVGDVDLLEKAAWQKTTGTLNNELRFVEELLTNAEYTTYNIVDNKFNFQVEQTDKIGYGYVQPGLAPTVAFQYEIQGESLEKACHMWQCSNLNATTAIVPQSLLNTVGGSV